MPVGILTRFLTHTKQHLNEPEPIPKKPLGRLGKLKKYWYLNNMPREIKFRVWDVLNRSYVYSADKESGWFLVKLNGEVVDGNGRHYDEIYPIQQFTGLKDKNGKDIYEGDILIALNRTTNRQIEVTYKESEGAFLFEGRLAFDFFQFNDVIVVGNIFENPELLK